MKNRKSAKEHKATHGATKTSYMGLTIGGIIAVAFVIMAFKVVPTVSPGKLVQAQLAAGPASSPETKLSVPNVVKGEPIIAVVPEKTNSAGVKTAGVSSPLPISTNGNTFHPLTTNVPVEQTSREKQSQKETYEPIGFDKLSTYRFDLTKEMVDGQPDPLTASLKISEEIPKKVKAFDGKLVASKGFMLPVKVENGLVYEFLLLKSQSACCYGIMPKINEWINVRLGGHGVKAIMDQPITVYGTLHVGETRENGLLTAIYRIDGEKVEKVVQ
jgi:hypothetical protein